MFNSLQDMYTCPNLSQILFVAKEVHESGMGANKLLIRGIISILYYKLQGSIAFSALL